MKTLILLSLALFNMNSVFAGSDKVIVELTHLNPAIEKVTVDEAGLLAVTKGPTHALLFKQLNPASLSQLTQLATTLAEAQISTTHHAIVCMIVIDPRREFKLSVRPVNPLNGRFSG